MNQRTVEFDADEIECFLLETIGFLKGELPDQFTHEYTLRSCEEMLAQVRSQKQETE